MDSISAGAHRFKYSGLANPDEPRHAVRVSPGNTIAPKQVQIPGGKYVNQYADTVRDTRDAYDPANDCDGYFMSSKFQPHNNCYAYGCDIATNSFAQPGRKNGLLLHAGFTSEQVEKGAEMDGLMTIAHQPLENEQLAEIKKDLPPGHFVALLISKPDEKNGWGGDYHWVRQDNDGSWSQKDGSDSVTNFDFAGHKISNPAKANWVVNQGPISRENPSDLIIGYDFYSIMYVPDGKVEII